jgi:hypothetical protein
MTASIPAFRGAFPPFSNTTKFPESEIKFWLDLATKLHNPMRWRNVLDEGIYLFTAHNLSIEFNAKTSACAGQSPGSIVGTVTSGSVDRVSYSRDASSAMDPKNGHWNLSSYGLRWIRLSRMMGAGPVYVGAPGPEELSASIGAWPGVIYPAH